MLMDAYSAIPTIQKLQANKNLHNKNFQTQTHCYQYIQQLILGKAVSTPQGLSQLWTRIILEATIDTTPTQPLLLTAPQIISSPLTLASGWISQSLTLTNYAIFLLHCSSKGGILCVGLSPSNFIYGQVSIPISECSNRQSQVFLTNGLSI